jgi:hypothetical protein
VIAMAPAPAALMAPDQSVWPSTLVTPEVGKVEREERNPGRKADEGQHLPGPDRVEGCVPAGLSRVRIGLLVAGIGLHGYRV